MLFMIIAFLSVITIFISLLLSIFLESKERRKPRVPVTKFGATIEIFLSKRADHGKEIVWRLIILARVACLVLVSSVLLAIVVG